MATFSISVFRWIKNGKSSSFIHFLSLSLKTSLITFSSVKYSIPVAIHIWPTTIKVNTSMSILSIGVCMLGLFSFFYPVV